MTGVPHSFSVIIRSMIRSGRLAADNALNAIPRGFSIHSIFEDFKLAV